MVAALLATLALLSNATAPTLPVSQAAGCVSAPTHAQLLSGTRACTIAAAERVAVAGDNVSVASGVYPPTQLTASGTGAAPITVTAIGAVTIKGGSASAALSLSGVHDIVVRGVAVTGGSRQGVWINLATRITLESMSITRSSVHGVQVNSSSWVTVAMSRVSKNRSAGIMETGADSHTRYVDDHVAHNGSGGSRYLGSGIELSGVDSRISGGLIKDNGTSRLYEHGVYVASCARGWLITGATITGSSGADVKAAGSYGTLAGSTLGSSRLGVYAIGHAVTLSEDRVRGSFLDGVVIAGGSTLIRHSLISNAATGWPHTAEAVYVTAGRAHLVAATLRLRGAAVRARRIG